MEKEKRIMIDGIELVCKANICYDPDGQLVLDLRDTDCSPKKAEKVLKDMIKQPNMRVRLPSVIEKPDIVFAKGLNKIMNQSLSEKQRDNKIKKFLRKHGVDEKYYKEVQKYDED